MNSTQSFSLENKPKLSICLPSYNGEKTIGKALKSILGQSYHNFEIIVNDDCSVDNTEEVIKSFKDQRIKFFRNKVNVGYGDNLNNFKKHLSGEIMIMMAQDDLLLKDALSKIVSGFSLGEDIGIVTRPYYQFESNPKIPVRYWPPPSTKKDTIISLSDKRELIEAALTFSYLVSCLAFKVKYLDRPFSSHVFTSQAYPFFSIFKKHKIVFLKDYIVAVGIYESQCRHKPAIYEPSPVQTWIEVFAKTLPEPKYEKVRKICQDYVAQNYVGLVQIRNYGRFEDLIEEIINHLKYRKASLIDFRFWFYTLMCLFLPKFILIRLTDFYKSKILSRMIAQKIKIKL
ncbi:glycosyltransferase [Patescibacteria group bacterium]|nr:glycosyltransferase [Patescibacteria group bacterium]